jgi:DNA helicase-2/ATP-dependent DNA helicase PcrA
VAAPKPASGTPNTSYPPRLSNTAKPGAAAARPAAAAQPRKRTPFAAGSTVQHPKFGRGTILRREGDGDDARLTVSFPGHGLKKLVQKYAGITLDE